MTIRPNLESILDAGRQVSEIDRGIFSALSTEAPPGRYDARGMAPVYDMLVGSYLYNHLVWKTDRLEYAGFEKQAIESASGWMLDAGCGSLVFTVDVFARNRDRPIILLDYSIAMLRRARHRLEHAAGRIPENVILLQADMFDLPFRSGSITTISAPFVFHLFENADALVSSLARTLVPDGGLFITSLVTRPGSRFSNWFLRRLHKAGEVATPRDTPQVHKSIEAACNMKFELHESGHVAFFQSRRS